MINFKPIFLCWCFVIFASLSNCLGTLLLKHSRLVAPPGLVSLLFCPWFIAGLCSYGIGVFLFAYALEVLPVSRAYPVLAGLGFTLLSIMASLLFGESLSFFNIVGMFFVFIGVVLLAM